MDVEIGALTQVTDEIVEAFGRMLPQLSASGPVPDLDTLSRVVEFASNTVLVARLGDEIVGTLTLVMFPALTGVRARIEDVVVDESARGRGVGAALTTAAMRLARSRGASAVELTSRPARTAANRLYQRLGFQLRETNQYRCPLI